jgi:membrane protease YdiL (CAAX protease family)
VEAGVQLEAGPVTDSRSGETTPALSRGALRTETLIVLALSLGASGVSALISFVGSVTKGGSLKDQPANLNASAAPGRPWLDLTWQLFDIASALVPVLLVAYLLFREGANLKVIGFDRRKPLFDLGRGAAIAACVGGVGIVFYLFAQGSGANLTVVPESLPDVWWKFPVLVVSAVQNAILEEVVVIGYLLRRLDRMGWSAPAALAGSALLRGSYHLYQGLGGFAGNVAMGIVFVFLYRRWGRVGPLVVAHSLMDIGAFVGYALLAGHVSWLPTL